jgi:N-acetylglucosamine malate deacetylase 2
MATSKLARLGWTADRPPRVLALLAHADDEAIGLGGQLGEWPQTLIVHATDGAPRDLTYARAKGFSSAADYAQARRRETQAAMSLVGLRDDALLNLGVSDQEASRNLVPLTRAFADLIVKRSPDVVVTHAYEGGHPDHDAVAFAARAALRLLPAANAPLLVEAPYYHSENGETVRQRFAPGGPPPIIVALSAATRELKRQMYACYVTQQDVLPLFHVESESFRAATPCDFSQPPNNGDILYESFGWNRTAAEFVALAQAALDELGLGPML